MKKLVILAIAALIFATTPAMLGCRQPERTEIKSDTKEVISKETREVMPGEDAPQQEPGE